MLCAAVVVLLTVNCVLAATNMSPATETDLARGIEGPRWDDGMELLAPYLEELLRDTDLWNAHEAPLLYVEDVNSRSTAADDVVPLPWKRSRYYRRYPWKRQNGQHRTQYADASRYMCTPTREDVFQLLVALHEAREGNTRRTVNFCNRKRPASSIFTNIRFLGRRK